MKKLFFSLAIIFSFAIFADSCEQSLGIEDQVRITKTLKFSTILKGSLIIISDTPFQKVIKSKTEETGFTETLVTNKFDTSGKPVHILFPDIDYSNEMVVAICLGSRPLANYDVEVITAVSVDDNVTIRAKETVPSIGQTIISSPIHFIRLAKTSGNVKIDSIEKVFM